MVDDMFLASFGSTIVFFTVSGLTIHLSAAVYMRPCVDIVRITVKRIRQLHDITLLFLFGNCLMTRFFCR